MIKNNNFIINIETKTKKWLDFKPVKYKNLESFFEYRINLLSLHTDLKKFLKNQNNQAEISIFLVSNQQIKKINQEFRNINKPTNVLTFGYLDEELIRNSNLNAILKNNNYHFLGDIFFAFEKIKSEAIKEKKSFENHLTHLILHSMLHIIGFDHQNEQEAEVMESMEIKILNSLDIRNPYQQN